MCVYKRTYIHNTACTVNSCQSDFQLIWLISNDITKNCTYKHCCYFCPWSCWTTIKIVCKCLTNCKQLNRNVEVLDVHNAQTMSLTKFDLIFCTISYFFDRGHLVKPTVTPILKFSVGFIVLKGDVVVVYKALAFHFFISKNSSVRSSWSC